MNKILSLLVFSVIILLTSCSSEDEPYVIFKDQNEQPITESTITVPLNSTYELYVDIGFDEDKGENNMIYYERQIDDGTVTDLTFTGTLDILAVGIFNNLTIERAKISLSFDEPGVISGSEVRIIVRDRWILRNALVFRVQ